MKMYRCMCMCAGKGRMNIFMHLEYQHIENQLIPETRMKNHDRKFQRGRFRLFLRKKTFLIIRTVLEAQKGC